MTNSNRWPVLGAMALMLWMGPATRADWLDPMAFGSLGTLNLVAGDYRIETNGAPVLLDSANNVLYTGTTYFQGGSFGSTVSVLDFDAIHLAVGANIRVMGDNPLALLSRSTAQIDGRIDATGFKGQDSARFGGSGAGGAGGAGAGKGGDWAQTGAGPGGGPAGPFGIGVVQAAGGSYGGLGGMSAFGTRGPTYGNLYQYLQGGSGGGGTGGSFFDNGNGAGGGGGGGAVELGASGSISFGVNAGLIANGGGVGAAFAANAGGGSGGGLLVHAPTIDIAWQSRILAQGGDYFGGGGRILILTDTATIINTGGTVDAGAGGGANNQEGGVVEYGYLRARVVPEPSTLAMMALGGLILGGWSRARRRV